MEGVFIMVVLIVAISVGAGMYREKQKTARQIGLNSAAGADLREELDALRDRVAVLEQIVTDKKYQLKDELERL